MIRPDYERPAPPPPVEPLYGLTDEGKIQGNGIYFVLIDDCKIIPRLCLGSETPDDVFVALRELGYNSFRAGQEEAIMRILSGT